MICTINMTYVSWLNFYQYPRENGEWGSVPNQSSRYEGSFGAHAARRPATRVEVVHGGFGMNRKGGTTHGYVEIKAHAKLLASCDSRPPIL